MGGALGRERGGRGCCQWVGRHGDGGRRRRRGRGLVDLGVTEVLSSELGLLP